MARRLTSRDLDELRMPNYTGTGDPRGDVDPAALRAAAQGGDYDIEARRAAIAHAVMANLARQAQLSPWGGDKPSVEGSQRIPADLQPEYQYPTDPSDPASEDAGPVDSAAPAGYVNTGFNDMGYGTSPAGHVSQGHAAVNDPGPGYGSQGFASQGPASAATQADAAIAAAMGDLTSPSAFAAAPAMDITGPLASSNMDAATANVGTIANGLWGGPMAGFNSGYTHGAMDVTNSGNIMAGYNTPTSDVVSQNQAAPATPDNLADNPAGFLAGLITEGDMASQSPDNDSAGNPGNSPTGNVATDVGVGIGLGISGGFGGFGGFSGTGSGPSGDGTSGATGQGEGAGVGVGGASTGISGGPGGTGEGGANTGEGGGGGAGGGGSK